jgi:hypothetical protein
MEFPIRKHLLPLAVSLAAVLAVTSCASFQRAGDQGKVRQLADLINSGQAAKLAGMSASPFLLDGEIIPLPADVSSFWAGIVKAGFRVQGAALESGVPVGADGYKQFASTMEVKSFFSRYVKDGARILELSTSSGQHIRILAKSEWFSWKIIGFKGPF